MGRRPMRIVTAAVLASAALAGLSLAVRAQQDQVLKSRAVFMRQKLELAKGVLEGLATEKYELVENNAKLLRRASMAAEWEVPGIPNAAEYLSQTAQFQKLCDDMTRAAKDRNLDAATLAYMRMTANCVDCHKYVRGFVR